METEIRWLENVHFEARSGTGHTVSIDGPPDSGGRDLGVRPMELMLMGVGGCTSFDIVNILTRGRQKVTNCVTRITARRTDTVPEVFEEIAIHFVVEGEGLDEKKVARAIELTAEKYCSASIMLQRAGVDIRHTFEVTEAQTR